MTPRRILLLITDLELGGTPTVVRELAIRLSQAVPSAHIEVTCLAGWGPVADQLQRAGVTVTALGARRPRDLQILPRLIHIIKEKKFDTVFSFLLHANAVAAMASLWTHEIRWIQAIQTTQPRPHWHWWVQRLIHRAADTIVVPSPSVAAAAFAWANVPAEKITVISNAVDPADFVDCQSSIPPLDPRPYSVTYLGRLDPIKDIPTLIRAVARLRSIVHLHIYGQGPDRRRIVEEIEIHGLESQVTLHGAIAQPQAAMRDSGLLVLPSLAEGFGLVLIEAMAAGVPIVATHVAGIRDVIQENETGLLVPPGNPELLANAIKQIVEQPILRQKLIDHGRSQVQARFSWATVLPQYASLLRLS